MRLALRVTIVVVALLLGAIPPARALAAHYLFPASEVASVEPPPDFDQVATAAADGVPVHALFARGTSTSCVVLFHNNRETAAHGAPLARAIRALGPSALLVEYRGYGASRGPAATEDGLYADAEAALAWLADRGTGPSRVVLWGTSLGTGVAAEMARRGRGAALVLVSPYTSIDDLITGVVPIAPTRVLLPARFDTLEKAPLLRLRVPTLVVHGDVDEIVPFHMGEEVARAAGARLVRVRGAHHGDLFARDGEGILAEVDALLARVR